MTKNILKQLGIVAAIGVGTLFGLARTASAATFVVTLTNDNDGPCFPNNFPGCSLRQAITAANATTATDRIEFNIVCGTRFINSTGPTLHITRRVIIDGTTQPFCGNPVPGDRTSLIELRGPGSQVLRDGLVLHGLVFDAGSSGSQVRGLAINGFSGAGIGLLSSNNVIGDSKLGTDATGRLARPNNIGISIGDTSNSNSVFDSLVSANVSTGIDIRGDSNQIHSNLIGTTIEGDEALPNGIGVSTFSANNNEIGIQGIGNTIAFNDSAGVRISLGNFNAIRGNSIHDNTGLGIDLIGTGANHGQVAPVVQSANVTYEFIPGFPPRLQRRTTIQGTLAGAGSGGFEVDLYGNDACHASGSGEGRKFLATAAVTNGSFVATTSTSTGSFITAIARSPDQDTSEFSVCLTIP